MVGEQYTTGIGIATEGVLNAIRDYNQEREKGVNWEEKQKDCRTCLAKDFGCHM